MYSSSLNFALFALAIFVPTLISQPIGPQPCFGVLSPDATIQKLSQVKPLYVHTSNLFENCTHLSFEVDAQNVNNGIITIQTRRVDQNNPNGGQVTLKYYLENTQPGQYNYYLSERPTGQSSGKVNIIGYNDSNKSFAVVFCSGYNYYYTVSSNQNEADDIINQLDALVEPINKQIDHFYVRKNKSCM